MRRKRSDGNLKAGWSCNSGESSQKHTHQQEDKPNFRHDPMEVVHDLTSEMTGFNICAFYW